MLQRIRQFYRAVKASVSESDMLFLQKYLDEKERAEFFRMAVFDQRHALNVAYTALRLSEGEAVNKPLLIKACLLHDIGRRAEDFCLWDKVINVLLARFLPNWSKKTALNIKNSCAAENESACSERTFLFKRKYALYIYYCHAQIGAQILSGMGLKEAGCIVEHHHDSDGCPGFNAELDILRRADELN